MMVAMIALLTTTVWLNSAFGTSDQDLAARHFFSTLVVPFLLKELGWTDTEANRIRLMDRIGTHGKRRHLGAGNIASKYLSPGCSCKEGRNYCDDYGFCEANKDTCSFKDGIFTTCKPTVHLAGYQGTAGFKFSTRWMDCLSWNFLPCYYPEIAVFYTKALQQGVYADAQNLTAFPGLHLMCLQ